MADEVLKEMIRQLSAQGVNLKGKKLVKINDHSLNVVTTGKFVGDQNFKAVNLYYDKGKDLYDVTSHKLKNRKVISKTAKGVYFDQLGDYFKVGSEL